MMLSFNPLSLLSALFLTMSRIAKFTSIVFILSLSVSIQARHIIGGDISYERLQGEEYQFTMKIYRDCGCSNCAFLDDPAEIAIYRCGGSVSCTNLTQATPFETLLVPMQTINNVSAPEYPCLVLPPNICVEEGVYQFKIDLPTSAESYHIVYQRCCRNVTINNIINPEDAGATFSVEVLPDAQQARNSSPVFNDFPPTVICVGEPIDFDHSATDPDGDQLVYSFCSPKLGGGPLGTNENPGNPSLCNGVAPSPPCPPPYADVRFVLPSYNPLAPMGGNPVVNIDTRTGMITGEPAVQGQFVVGVCVKEYRNGILMGELRRDFQFNVTSCEPTVVAAIASDENVNDREFVINSCGNNTITFENNSFQRQYVDVQKWSFDINGEEKTSDAWSPTITFPEGTGTYEGTLILNPGTDCGDTANIFVNIFPEIIADFDYEYDTCVAGPVVFTNNSYSGAGQITDYNWAFGDGQTSDRINPTHDYQIPGDLPATLTVTDINNCQATSTEIISYYPVPSLIVIRPSEFIGCAPGDIFFDNLSTPIDESYDIIWDFGDGKTVNAVSPTHTYEDPGIFTVSIDITSPIGCKTDTIFPDLIQVDPSPTAGFIYNPDQPSNILPEVTFTDQSSGAVSWFWDFGGIRTSMERNPVFTFPDTGQHVVTQVVTHLSGCTDTFIQLIDVIPEVRYFLPNAFTPNSDNSNDEFRGEGKLEGATDFKFTIWNRWGELLFETTDPKEAWNGKKENTGKMSQNGVYVCVVTFTGPRGKKHEYKGFATLVR